MLRDRDDDKVQYTRYVTTLVTLGQGTIVGRPDQHLPELVGEVYGQPNGYLPWSENGFVGLIVTVPEENVQYNDLDDRNRPTSIHTYQRVLDWVVSMTQEPVR